MPKSATRILLEGKLPEIKADYLKGMSSIKLSEKYIPNYKGRSSTTLESIIKEMKEGKLPTKRSEEHTSELQSQSTISYAVFCLKKKKDQ